MNDTARQREPAWDAEAARRQLVTDGYCHVPGVLDPAALRATVEAAEAALGTVGADHRAQWRSQGSLVPIADHPSFAPLDRPSRAFRRCSDGSASAARASPPATSSASHRAVTALFWHQDWWGWQHPISREDRIAQVALFLYMTDTTRQNGCLRLVPGTHRRRHPLHDLVDAHDPTLAEVKNPDDAAFASHPDEIDVPVTAGDVVVVDARLIHGAHPNRSGRERTNITLWWHPDYESLPASLRARIWHVLRARGNRYRFRSRPLASPRYLARAPAQPSIASRRHRPRPYRAGTLGPRARVLNCRCGWLAVSRGGGLSRSDRRRCARAGPCRSSSRA